MYCQHCGTQRPDDARFCPTCGASYGEPTDPSWPRRSLTGAFGSAASGLFSRRSRVSVPTVLAATLLGYLVVAVGLALTVLAGFGTLWPRRIVNTNCLVHTHTTYGSSTLQQVPGCDLLRIDPEWSLLVPVAVATVVAYILALILGWVMTARAAAYLADDRYRLWPGPRVLLRAARRAIGWGVTLALLAMVAWILWIVIVVVLVRVLPLLLVIVIPVSIWLVIQWVAPLGVRATLAVMLMVVDDRPFGECWGAVHPTIGQAWAFIGLTIVISIAGGVASQVTNLLFSQGGIWIALGIVISLLVTIYQTLFSTLFTVLTARALSGDATRAAAA